MPFVLLVILCVAATLLLLAFNVWLWIKHTKIAAIIYIVMLVLGFIGSVIQYIVLCEQPTRSR